MTARELAHARALPSHARLVGVSGEARPVWVRTRMVRRTAYEDIYFPLDAPAPRTGGPTRLLGLASFVLGYGDAPGGREIVLDQPFEGSLAHVSLAAWQREALAARGIVVSDPVLLVTQDRTLAGRYPGRDRIGACVVLVCGGAGAAVFLATAVSCLIRRRRRLLSVTAGAGGRRG